MALLDYLTKRREEIEAQMKALRSELGEIKVAEAALLGQPLAKTTTVVGAGTVIRAGTIKDWIMKVMAAYPGGLETDSVIEAVRKMGGPIVERSSITPQLSRLKAGNAVKLDGKLWRLPTPAETDFDKLWDGVNDPTPENETPDEDQSSGASADEDDEFDLA